MRLGLFLLLVSVNATAEPSNAFRYLMDEPLTLFEWGLYHLDKYTDHLEFTRLNLISNHSNINYDWDANRLRVEFVVYAKNKSLAHTSAKDVCKEAMRSAREDFAVKYDSKVREFMGISRFFEHIEFRNSTRPKNLMAEIENATWLIVKVYASDTDTPPYTNLLSCEGPLMGSKTLILEGSEN